MGWWEMLAGTLDLLGTAPNLRTCPKRKRQYQTATLLQMPPLLLLLLLLKAQRILVCCKKSLSQNASPSISISKHLFP